LWLLVWIWPGAALAELEPVQGEITDGELTSWLGSDPEPASPTLDAEADEPALPAPRARGFVIEGSLGALGHLGDMRAVSPISPWFRLQLGYELFDWLMVFGEGDVALSTTSLANRPPEERGYALFGAGAGARLSWQPLTLLGFYLQGDAGLSSVNQDILSTYGYADADRLRPYFGGAIGVEWFQVSPHYALAIQGGVRDYVQNFERTYGTRPPLVWLSALTLRYTL
jgi:hypothetical protein